MMLHPVLRLLWLLALAAALPAMSLSALALLGAVTVGIHARRAAAALRRLRDGLLRLRYLLLAIFVLYAGFTPGEALHPALPGISREGLLEGLRRALVLADLLVLVYLLLALTPLPELVAALALLMRPLRRMGIDGERVALRVALALEGIAGMQQRLQALRGAGATWTGAAALMLSIEREAGQPGPPVAVPVLPAPRAWQYLLPLLAGLALQRWTP